MIYETARQQNNNYYIICDITLVIWDSDYHPIFFFIITIFFVFSRIWGSVLKNWEENVKKNNKLIKQLVRRGVPDPLRGMAWQLLSGPHDESLKKMYPSLIIVRIRLLRLCLFVLLFTNCLLLLLFTHCLLLLLFTQCLLLLLLFTNCLLLFIVRKNRVHLRNRSKEISIEHFRNILSLKIETGLDKNHY